MWIHQPKYVHYKKSFKQVERVLQLNQVKKKLGMPLKVVKLLVPANN